MRRSSWVLRCVNVKILVCLPFLGVGSCGGSAHADEGQNKPRPVAVADDAQDKENQQLLESLKTSTSINFQATKLRSVIDMLATIHELPIVIDLDELKKAGIDPDFPINLVIDGVPLSSALSLILEPLDLGWYVAEGKITITTAKNSAGPNVEVLYAQYAKFEDVIKSEDEKAAQAAFEKAIYTTIAPQSWKASGGQGAIDWTEKGLVVTNNAAVQKQFEQLTWYLTKGHKLIRSSEKSFPLNIHDAPRVAEVLTEQTEFDLIDQPLIDVMAFLADLHNINILVDTKAMHNAGISVDSPITLEAQGQRFSQVLDQFLEPLKLDHVARHNVLIVTTQEKVDALRETHIYDVKKLLGRKARPEVITEFITSKVLPKTWSQNGGQGTTAYVPGYFIVYQTPRAHRKILERFKTLRQRLDGNAVEKP